MITRRIRRFMAMLLACAAVIGLGTQSVLAESNVQAYTATVKGFGGDVTVTLTIENGKIVKCAAQGDAETEGIGKNAIE